MQRGLHALCTESLFSVSARIKVHLPRLLKDISTSLSKHIINCLSKVKKKQTTKIKQGNSWLKERDVSVYYADHSFQFALHMPTWIEKQWKLFFIDTNLNTSEWNTPALETSNKCQTCRYRGMVQLEIADEKAANLHKTCLKRNPRNICYSLVVCSLLCCSSNSWLGFFLGYVSDSPAQHSYCQPSDKELRFFLRAQYTY